MNKACIRYGFIGAGQVTHVAAKQIHQDPRGRVVAAFDTNPLRSQELAKAFALERVHATAEALVRDPEVDAVYVAVPTKFHAEMAILALEAGKAVLLEKPMAMDYAEAAQVAAVARRTGRPLLVGMNQRYMAGPQQVRRQIMSGALGDIYHAKGFWNRRQGIPKLGTWFSSKQLAGAGALFDIGVHMLDLSLFLLGNFRPVSVTGATYTKFGHRGLGAGNWSLSESQNHAFDVDDFATALIKLEGGVTLNLDVSWAAHQSEANLQDVRLFGTEAAATVHPPRLYRPLNGSEAYETIETLPPEMLLPHTNRFTNLINHLLDGEPLLVKVEEALTVQRLLDGIRKSSETGDQVCLSE